MSVRNLDKLLAPRSIALVGASARPGSVGAVTLRNLLRAGFAGRIDLVNPRHTSLAGRTVYSDVAALPEAPDLVIIATPPDTVPGLIAGLGARGTKAAVVITAGFGELGEQGRALQQQSLAAARPHLMRLVGPNCVGLMVPGRGIDASFSHLAPLAGDLAFLSQSGAMITAMLDWTVPRGIGFSHVVSLGDMADVDFGDMLEYLAADAATRAILLYVEGVTHARKFIAAARRAARTKPVLVVKVGRFAESARAARSHTGAMAGSDAVYDAAFRRAGILRVASMTELFDAVESLALTEPLKGERLAILTNGGGPGVLATDALIGLGGTLASLAPDSLAKLDARLPATWSRGNPVDIIGDAPAPRYADALRILLEAPEIDAVLALNCPTALAGSTDAAQAVIATYRAACGDGRSCGTTLFAAWLGGQSAEPARRLFATARIASYDTPDDAVAGFMHRVRHRRNQLLLSQEPAEEETSPAAAPAAVRTALAAAHHGGRRWLDADEVALLLDAYGIPQPMSRVVSDAAGAEQAAASIGRPVALKIRSPDLTHKSDIGGVVLNLANPARVAAEAAAMQARIRASHPAARLDGFLVQEIVSRPGALELIVGATEDATFGPVLLFGHGGTAVELIGDSSLELLPLTPALARSQMARTRVWRLMQGYRGHPAVDIDAVAEILVRVARLVTENPEVVELDINPLLADAAGALALDCRIGLRRAGEARIPAAAQ